MEKKAPYERRFGRKSQVEAELKETFRRAGLTIIEKSDESVKPAKTDISIQVTFFRRNPFKK